jgi:hypothetical protein
VYESDAVLNMYNDKKIDPKPIGSNVGLMGRRKLSSASKQSRANLSALGYVLSSSERVTPNGGYGSVLVTSNS